jgi:phage-related protein
MRNTRQISWIKAARKDFEEFPEDVQGDMFDALTIAAEGVKSDRAKPFKGIDGGVFEIALKYRGDAFRTLYAVKIDTDIWVINLPCWFKTSAFRPKGAPRNNTRKRLLLYRARIREGMQTPS